MRVFVEPARKGFVRRLRVPSDKSITHRAFMLAAVAKGTSVVQNPLMSEDCKSTIACLERCGVGFEVDSDLVRVKGGRIEEPVDVLHAGNSGTTARLLMGLLSGYPIFFVLSGDDSLKKRPMGRVAEPLSLMGARIMGRAGNSLLPMALKGGDLRGIEYGTKVASAQVKSAILLAGLRAEGETVVVEPSKSRDHTERMLKSLGVDLEVEGCKVRVRPSEVPPFSLRVPGDPSSAAFWIAAAVLIPGSEVVVEEVLLNPTRIGFFEVLRRMGAEVEWEVAEERLGEPVGVVRARYTPELRPVEIGGAELPTLIDEVPLLALVASKASGTTRITEARELRVKESDRISATVEELSRIGVSIEELEDGMVVRGPSRITGGSCKSHGDHRIAMMLAIAGLASERGVEIEGAEWVSISYPGFFEVLGP